MVEIISAFSVSEKALEDFYSEVYSGRSISLSDRWKWLYRTSFLEKTIPLIIVEQGKVIGHAGIIPFQVNLNGKCYSAGWYVDFALLSSHQRMGYGCRITEKWMELSEVFFTFCNEQSIGVFKKMGWIESFESNLHYFFLRPLDHPKLNERLSTTKIPGARIFQKIVNDCYQVGARWFFGVKKKEGGNSKVIPLDEKSLDRFLFSVEEPTTGIIPVRDREYANWRFLESPDCLYYRIFESSHGLSAILRDQRNKEGSSHLDILWINRLQGTNHDLVVSFLASICLWASENGFSYVRCFIPYRDLSKRIHLSLLSMVRHPRHSYFSQNNELYHKIKKAEQDGHIHWQLLDSDFEE